MEKELHKVNDYLLSRSFVVLLEKYGQTIRADQ